MKTRLAKELLKYYSRKGNRIIFSNGMTLNQLAWRMWEILEYTNCEPSVLSRVLKGERIFTLSQLEAFSKALKLRTDDVNKLKEGILIDYGHRFGLDVVFYEHDQRKFVDEVESNLVQINQLRRNDLPKMAAEWLDNVYDRIQQELIIATDKNRKTLLSLLSKVIPERMDSLLMVVDPVSYDSLGIRLTNELYAIGKELGSSYLQSFSKFQTADWFYIHGNYDNAIELFKYGIRMEPVNDEFAVTVRALRGMALSFAYLGNRNGFRQTKDKLLKGIDRYEDHFQILVYEGVARGEVLLGDYQNAEGYIDKGWSLYHTVSKIPGRYKAFRAAQLTRTELQFMEKVGTKNKNRGLRIGQETLLLSKQLGYDRYSYLIEKSLTNYFN